MLRTQLCTVCTQLRCRDQTWALSSKHVTKLHPQNSSLTVKRGCKTKSCVDLVKCRAFVEFGVSFVCDARVGHPRQVLDCWVTSPALFILSTFHSVTRSQVAQDTLTSASWLAEIRGLCHHVQVFWCSFYFPTILDLSSVFLFCVFCLYAISDQVCR